jgi:hypothetical protein
VRKRNLTLVAFACCFTLANAARGQEGEGGADAPQRIQRAVKGPADKDIQIGVFINVRPDCQSGPLPTIRLAEPPAHGKVVVKKAQVNATNYRQCLALQAPGYVAFYRSTSDFVGEDYFTLEVSFPGGRREIQKFTATIGLSQLGPKI